MSDTDDVKLREHVEEMIKLRFDKVEAVMEERQRALELLAQNIDTHLTHLNGVQAQTVKDRDEFLLISVYKEMHKSLEDRLTKIEETMTERIGGAVNQWSDRIASVEKAQARYIGMGFVLIPLAGILGAIVTHVFFK